MLVLVVMEAQIARLAILLLVLLHVAISCALGGWFIVGQRQYIREYRRVHRLTSKELPLSDEIQYGEYFPFNYWRGQTALLDAYFISQADNALERKRQRTFWRMGLTLMYWVIGSIALLVMFS